MSILYITDQGSSVHLKSHQLEVHRQEEGVVNIPTESITNLLLFGGVHITSDAINYLARKGVDISFLTLNGKFKSRVCSHSSKNIPLRFTQYKIFFDDTVKTELIRKNILKKIEYSEELLNEYHKNSRHIYNLPAKVLTSIEKIKTKIISESQIDTLRGYEGAFGHIYFAEYAKLFTHDSITFSGRSFFPACDPINALLSLGYSFISREIESLCEAQGLDSHIGFFHTPTYGRASLAMDLVEPFRSKHIDTMVVKLINHNDFSIEDFNHPKDNGALFLSRDGMKKFIKIYERFIRKERNGISFRKELRNRVDEYHHYLQESSNENISNL